MSNRGRTTQSPMATAPSFGDAMNGAIVQLANSGEAIAAASGNVPL